MTTASTRLFRAARARWGLAVRAVTLGVRAIALDAQGRVLLVRHGYEKGWHLPGGAVDLGESAEEAAMRELCEETGVIAEGRPKLVGLFYNPAFGGRDHVALFLFERFAIGPTPAPNREIAEAAWFPRDALPPETTAATLRRLAELEAGAAPAGRW